MNKKICALLLTAALCLGATSCGLVKKKNEAEVTDNSYEVTDEANDPETGDVITETEDKTAKEKNSENTENITEDAVEIPDVINPELADTKTAKTEEILDGDYFMALDIRLGEDENGEMSSMYCEYAIDDENSYFRFSTEKPVMDFSLLVTPETQYTIDNSSKQYVEGVADALASLTSVVKRIKISDIYKSDASLSSEKVTVDGVEYDAETFVGEEDSDSKSLYLFDDDGKLKYIILSDADTETVIEVKKLTSELPDGIFEIPEDYSEYISVTTEQE